MSKKDITSLRATIEFLEGQGEVLHISNEVDPIYEISGIEKALENSQPILFENIKGYPGVRNVGNLFGRMETIAKIFGVDDPKKFKFKALDAIRHPIPAKAVQNAPCQEVLITDNIDVPATLPIIKHSERDSARILGCGIYLTSGSWLRGGNDLAFKRTHFRGKDWASVLILRGTQLGDSVHIEHKGETIPVTVNIGVPPAVLLVAGTWSNRLIMPMGTDQLGIAGGLQGKAVEICKAKTVNAYAIAEAEWVIEGYVNSDDKVWETEEAEKIGQARVAPLFPEYTRHLGTAFKIPKLQVTGITHRKDRPIFYTPLADSYEGDNLETPLTEACYLEIAERLTYGLVQDVNILHGQVGFGGVVFQIKKRRKGDEGLHIPILEVALISVPGLKMVIAVDDDVDIYCAEEVIWAITTRLNPGSGIIRTIGQGARQVLMPTELAKTGKGGDEFHFQGGVIIDATVPWDLKQQFERARYPVKLIDLKRWLTDEQIAVVQLRQSEYARVLAEKGA